MIPSRLLESLLLVTALVGCSGEQSEELADSQNSSSLDRSVEFSERPGEFGRDYVIGCIVRPLISIRPQVYELMVPGKVEPLKKEGLLFGGNREEQAYPETAYIKGYAIKPTVVKTLDPDTSVSVYWMNDEWALISRWGHFVNRADLRILFTSKNDTLPGYKDLPNYDELCKENPRTSRPVTHFSGYPLGKANVRTNEFGDTVSGRYFFLSTYNHDDVGVMGWYDGNLTGGPRWVILQDRRVNHQSRGNIVFVDPDKAAELKFLDVASPW